MSQTDETRQTIGYQVSTKIEQRPSLFENPIVKQMFAIASTIVAIITATAITGTVSLMFIEVKTIGSNVIAMQENLKAFHTRLNRVEDMQVRLDFAHDEARRANYRLDFLDKK